MNAEKGCTLLVRAPRTSASPGLVAAGGPLSHWIAARGRSSASFTRSSLDTGSVGCCYRGACSMPLPLLLAVDEDQDVLEDVEAQLVQRYGHDYRVECSGDPDEALRTLTELATPARRWRWCSRPRRSAGARASSCSSKRASSIRTPSVRCLVPLDAWTDPPTAGGDPRLDGARAHRLLRAQAGGLAGRGVPPGDLELPARVGDGARPRSADRPHRRRDVVGQGLRAEGGLRAAARSRTPSAWPTPTRGASCSPRRAPTRSSR